MNRYSANDFTPNAGQIARGMGHWLAPCSQRITVSGRSTAKLEIV